MLHAIAQRRESAPAWLAADGTDEQYAETVIDLALAVDRVPARITHRITYDVPADASALTLIGSRTLNGPALTVASRLPLVIASPLRGDGWLTSNGC